MQEVNVEYSLWHNHLKTTRWMDKMERKIPEHTAGEDLLV